MANSVDIRVLIAGLKAYHGQLTQHINQLHTECSSVESAWKALDAVYEGDSADNFRSCWQKSLSSFSDYSDQAAKIAEMLEERIEHLIKVNGGKM